MGILHDYVPNIKDGGHGMRYCKVCGRGRMKLIEMRLLPNMHSLQVYKCDNIMCGHTERVMK